MADPIRGTLHRYPDFGSRFVSARTVDVWLPPGYTSEARLPVVYAHDGQNLFDPTLSFTGVDWGVDEAVAELTEAGDIEPAIIVGIWNTDHRAREYMPGKALAKDPGAYSGFVRDHGGSPLSDRYLRFMVEEVKPRVDQEYATRAGPESTFTMGSSMGGLISLYALCEYTEVFSAAACLSTHWPAAGGAVVDYVGNALPAPGRHRLYFDYGTETPGRRVRAVPTARRCPVAGEGLRSGIGLDDPPFRGSGPLGEILAGTGLDPVNVLAGKTVRHPKRVTEHSAPQPRRPVRRAAQRTCRYSRSSPSGTAESSSTLSSRPSICNASDCGKCGS